MRKVYPGYFSKMVMAHEMEHYFGLCHINHNGVQNIMFSTAAGNSVLDWGLFGYYLNAEPYFTSRDKRNVWASSSTSWATSFSPRDVAV